jgi:hypothetical protein
MEISWVPNWVTSLIQCLQNSSIEVALVDLARRASTAQGSSQIPSILQCNEHYFYVALCNLDRLWRTATDTPCHHMSPGIVSITGYCWSRIPCWGQERAAHMQVWESFGIRLRFDFNRLFYMYPLTDSAGWRQIRCILQVATVCLLPTLDSDRHRKYRWIRWMYVNVGYVYYIQYISIYISIYYICLLYIIYCILYIIHYILYIIYYIIYIFDIIYWMWRQL